MAGVITALKIQKRNKERINVFLDGQYAFAVDGMAAARLQKGQYLADDQIAQLQQEDERTKAYQAAIRYLGYRPRSRTEVQDYLQRKHFSDEVARLTIDRLLEEQYLDDVAFARFWLRERERFRPRGCRALRYELHQKGVADQVIDRALADVDEYELAWAAAEAKLNRWRKLDRETFTKKVTGFLSRRGFNYEVVRHTRNRAWSALHPSS